MNWAGFLRWCAGKRRSAAADPDARLEGGDTGALAERLALFFAEHLNHPRPYYYSAADGTPKQFAFCPIVQYGACREADSGRCWTGSTP